ncbi:MAG: hypothetical protein ACRYFS_01755 [Janthinobacterium lividum]
MERKTIAMRVGLTALAALTVAGMMPHTAFADADKGKGKKSPVIIGPITKTPDPPKK